MRLILSFVVLTTSAVAGFGEDKFFDSDGVRIRYIEQGAGEPVVLVHGFGGSADVWVKSGVYEKLAKNYRVIAMDCRGHGKSDKPRDPKQYGRKMCLDILRLLDHLEIERAHIVGYSMGGSLTLQLATIHPERILSATLGGTAGRYAFSEERLAEIYKTADWLNNTPVRDIVLYKWPKDKPQPSEEELKQLEADYLATHDPKALAAVRYSYAEQIVSKAEVAAIQVPFLSIIGTEDFRIGEVKNLKQAMPALKIVTIEGATHGGKDWAGGHPKFIQSLQEFLQANAAVASPADEPADDKQKKASDVEGAADDDIETAAKESRAAVERFFKEWNTGDNANLRKALHYPFISVGRNGQVHVAKTPDEFEHDFEKMRTNQNWDHSTFDKIEPLSVVPDKAHYKVNWSRHDTSGQRYVTGEILYIVTKKDGRRAFAVRSSIWHRKIEPRS